MVESVVTIEKGTAVVTISGAAGIDTAGQIHQKFLEAYESGFPVVLDLSKTSECDGTFVQLVSSLCFSLKKGGRSLDFRGEGLPDPIFEVVRILGFNFQKNCTRTDASECLFSKSINKSSSSNQEHGI